jgi:hypothetical protein
LLAHVSARGAARTGPSSGQPVEAVHELASKVP